MFDPTTPFLLQHSALFQRDSPSVCPKIRNKWCGHLGERMVEQRVSGLWQAASQSWNFNFAAFFLVHLPKRVLNVESQSLVLRLLFV